MRNVNEILSSSGWRDATGSINSGAHEHDQPEADLCKYCAGAGYVRRAVRLGHPDFGKAFPCRCTEAESDEERADRLRRYSNLGSLSRLTFDNLSPQGRSPDPEHQQQFEQAFAAARRFSQEPAGWLLFTGPSGSGKTHLAAAIAGRRLDAGQGALFMVVPDLLDHLRAAYQPDSELGYDDLFELLKGAPVLVLDDLGVQSSTPWAQEKLFQLINHRYNAQLPTVVTTNLDPTAFESRLESRLSDPALTQVLYLERGGAAAGSDLDALALPRLREMTFKSFEPSRCTANSVERHEVENAYRQGMSFARDPRNWFLLAGPSGKGKTRLAAAIGNYRRQQGQQVLFVVVPDLLDRLRSGYQPASPRESSASAGSSFDAIFDEVRSAPLLVLDDLGAESGTAWADEKLFQLINYRYNAALPTVFTCSATLNELPSRIRTRLMDMSFTDVFLIGDGKGEFDFWGKQPFAGGQKPATRGRQRRA